MLPLADFFARNSILIYFIYGLAFFSMGFAILLEVGRSSEIKFARALRPLALFGLMHGVHEWGEMFQKVLALTYPGYVLPLDQEVLRLIWLAASFIALLPFGLLILTAESPHRAGWVWRVPLGLTLLWSGGIPLLRAYVSSPHEWLIAADVWARYTLGMPAGLLAAVGFVAQQRSFRAQGLTRFGHDMLWAAIAFGWYGVFGQLFTPRSVIPPSTFLNSELFFNFFGVPIELFRALMAAASAVFILRSLRAFEEERTRQLAQLKEIQMREAEERQRLQRDLLHQIVTAQEAERQRIARELHDETGQSLTAIGLGLRGIQATLKKDLPRAAKQLSELQTHANQALDELRRLVADLRPAQLDDLGLIPTLRWYVKQVAARSGVEVQLETHGKQNLSPELNTVLFRITQEALTNVVRHAHAQHAQVRLCLTETQAELIVGDDGKGFEISNVLSPHHPLKAWGLLGMHERATLVGGELQIESHKGQGTQIKMRVPIK